MEAENLSANEVLRLLPDPVLVVDGSGILIWGNAAAEQVFGWALDERIGRSCFDLIHDDDQINAILSLGSVQQKDLGTAIECRVKTPSGEYRLAEIRGRSALDVVGVEGVILVLRDLTDRRRWELGRGDVHLFQTLLEYSTTITMLLDPDGTIRSTNLALPRQLGHDPAVAEGRPLEWLVAPADVEAFRSHLSSAVARTGLTSFEARLRHGSGGTIPYQLNVTNLIPDPVVSGLVVTAHDISELYRARERLSHLATHDPLTELANRPLFSDRLAHAFELARRRDTALAVLFCDLDSFKRVNDLHGHATGDETLVETARRIRSAVRTADTVARLGGDEFAVLAEDVDEAEARHIADRVRSAFADPIIVHGRRIGLTVSVGWALGDGGDDERAVLARADAAMYHEKLEKRTKHDRSQSDPSSSR